MSKPLLAEDVALTEQYRMELEGQLPAQPLLSLVAKAGYDLLVSPTIDEDQSLTEKFLNARITGAGVHPDRPHVDQDENNTRVLQPADVKGKVDVGIITIREDEFEAVLDRFPATGRVIGRRQYNLRKVDLAGGGSYQVAVLRCIEQGNIEAQSAAHDLLEDLSPRWLVVVGIAGGIPADEFSLGDVIVSTRICDFSVEAVLQESKPEYALGGGPVDKVAAVLAANLPALKAELGNWNAAASIAIPRPALNVGDDALYGNENWRDRVRKSLRLHEGRATPKVTAGAIASSDRLLKDTEALTVWMKIARQVLAVEMESAGVYRAIYGWPVSTLSIRGISDIVGLKRDSAWTKYACHTAASFAFALLQTRLFDRSVQAVRPVPDYPDGESRQLSERIAEARERKKKLQAAGASTTAIDQEILGLRRQLREGGQLREGDWLGNVPYLLLRRIGRGGFATVWEAYDEGLKQRVAIKVLHSELARDPTRRERFARGARVMSELGHEAIVRILAPPGEDGGFYYFVMECMKGGDLHSAVLSGRISPREVIPIILRVGAVLAQAHARNFIHRDIKPANILLNEAGAPYLTDFDLVGGLDTTGGTRTGALGTFLYAAPELLHRPQEADARADVYSLGMTALFGLSGQELTLDIFQDTKKKKLINRLPCSRAIRQVISKAVAQTHSERFRDAAEFYKALEEAYTLKFTQNPNALQPKQPSRKKAAKRKPNAAFMKKFMPSSELAAVVGAKPLTRTAVIKNLWDYIKKNELNQGQLISLDDRLKRIYGNKKQIKMTEVAIAFRHLQEAETLKVTQNPQASPPKQPSRKKAASRKPNAAFMEEFMPSPELAAVVGAKPLTRTAVIKNLWDYIKKNGLNQGQLINLDDRLKRIYGNKKQIKMTEVAIAFRHLK